MSEISFSLKPVPPFSLSLTVWALRRRPSNQIDLWEGGRYSRIVVIDEKTVRLAVCQHGGTEKPRLKVTVLGKAVTTALKPCIVSLIDKMFSIGRDLSDFYSLAHRDKRLRPLADRLTGVKPPRFPAVFEALVNAFSCQQVSLDLGIILLNRLSQAFGAAYEEGGRTLHAFPRPEDLAGLSPEDFRKLGFSRNKGRAIIELSVKLLNRELDVEALERESDEEAIDYLMKIRGVGRWTAEYTLLRGLGRINVFPGDDVGAQKNFQTLFGLDERPGYEKIKKMTARWQPYAGFVYFHFLLDKLNAKGVLT